VLTIHTDRRITPRITRPPKPSTKHDKRRVAGRVHALVRPPKGSGLSLPRIRPLLSGDLTLAITGEHARLMITGTLYASPVERLVRPPTSVGIKHSKSDADALRRF
jgi:hypothetical protein